MRTYLIYNIQMKKLVLFVVFATIVNIANAQTKMLPNGMTMRYLVKGKGKKSPKIGDYATVKIKGQVSGKEFFNSKTVNKGNDAPILFKVVKPTYSGDVIAALQYLVDGDSVQVIVPADSFYRGPQRPPFYKKGDNVIYYFKMFSMQTPAEYAKAQADYKKQLADQKKMQENINKQIAQQKKDALQAKKQVALDDKAITDYLNTNGINNFQKTASGLYYVIDEPGTGDLPKAKQEMTMNYTGQLLNGKKFDSNVDTAFHHVAPFNFPLGQGRVIRGWDEGIALLKKGGKAKLFIPSALGYGAQGSGANIPPFSPLRFDVEVLDFNDPAPPPPPAPKPEELSAADDAAINTYLKSKGITATKLPSGLYIQTTTVGNGESPKAGDNVSMNYTGTLLDGTNFDSNLLPEFGHTQPLNFPLGQGRVIKGWDEGIATLKKGGKAKLLIPSSLAYGAGSPSAKIPANSVLTFDVELLDFTPATK